MYDVFGGVLSRHAEELHLFVVVCVCVHLFVFNLSLSYLFLLIVCVLVCVQSFPFVYRYVCVGVCVCVPSPSYTQTLRSLIQPGDLFVIIYFTCTSGFTIFYKAAHLWTASPLQDPLPPTGVYSSPSGRQDWKRPRFLMRSNSC